MYAPIRKHFARLCDLFCPGFPWQPLHPAVVEVEDFVLARQKSVSLFHQTRKSEEVRRKSHHGCTSGFAVVCVCVL